MASIQVKCSPKSKLGPSFGDAIIAQIRARRSHYRPKFRETGARASRAHAWVKRGRHLPFERRRLALALRRLSPCIGHVDEDRVRSICGFHRVSSLESSPERAMDVGSSDSDDWLASAGVKRHRPQSASSGSQLVPHELVALPPPARPSADKGRSSVRLPHPRKRSPMQDGSCPTIRSNVEDCFPQMRNRPPPPPGRNNQVSNRPPVECPNLDPPKSKICFHALAPTPCFGVCVLCVLRGAALGGRSPPPRMLSTKLDL